MDSTKIIEGAIAPDFELSSASGQTFHLYQSVEQAAVVLFFYVKPFTPVCAAEVCSFRENAAEFARLNAAIFGIASASAGLTKRFSAYHALPFPLLLDPGDSVRKLYGVPKLLGLFPGRSTYVIGQDRRILQVTHAAFASNMHVLASLNSLRSESST